jgi:hypothetical protein
MIVYGLIVAPRFSGVTLLELNLVCLISVFLNLREGWFVLPPLYLFFIFYYVSRGWPPWLSSFG